MENYHRKEYLQSDSEEIDEKCESFDIAVVFGEDDRLEALNLRKHLCQDILNDGTSLKVVLYDDDRLKSIENAFRVCTFVFIYLSKSFCENYWKELRDHECIKNAIYERNTSCNVIPVLTAEKTDVKVPMGLNALNGIKYYRRDKLYYMSLRKLISDKLSKRKQLEVCSNAEILR